MRIRFITLLAVGVFIYNSAYAACTGGIEGQIEYETVANVYRYCDGTDWVNISGGGGGATDIDGLSDAKYDTTTDFNMFIGHTGGSVGANDDYNLAIGQQALDALNNTHGDYNVAVGFQSLSSNTTGDQNIAIGVFSSVFNISGQKNVAVGYSALRNSSAGSYNVAIGHESAYGASPSSISNNVMLGYHTGYVLDTGGNDNTLIGYQAGDSITTGARNIIIGSGVDIDSATNSDYLNIGNAIYGDMGTTTSQSTSDAEIIIDGALVATDITTKSTLILQDYGSGTHTGTATYTLAVDSSGNVIEEDAYDPGTWEDVTSLHANLTDTVNWQCRMDSMRQVFFTGTLYVTTTIASSTTIGVLPTNCRPNTTISSIVLYYSTTGSKSFSIDTSGNFISNNGMQQWVNYPVNTITYGNTS